MNEMMEKLRQRISTGGINFVSAPYLPDGLIKITLLLAFTNLIVILLCQPAGYWIDRSRAISNFSFLEVLLSAGVLFYTLVGILYLVLLWVVLNALTRSIALVLWMPVSFVHLTHIAVWAGRKSGFVDAAVWSQPAADGIGAASALILGMILVRVLLHPRSTTNATTGLKGWIKSAVLILWVVFFISAVLVTAFGQRGGWARLQPEHSPGRRGSSAVAYDSDRQRIVLFGGKSDWIGSKFLYENDTWEWDGDDWIEIHPRTAPQARANHMLAFDEKRGVVVLFGGEDKSGEYMLSDTWEWDGSDWKQVFPENYPQSRSGGQLFYDPGIGKVVLSGGYYLAYPDKTVTLINDAWEWDGRNWNILTYLTNSLIVANSSVTYDPLRGQPILFDYDKIMVWEDGAWEKIPIGTDQVARYGTRPAFDLIGGQMLIFGGLNNAIQLNDTWLLKDDAWIELHPNLAPGPRDAHVMFYDPIRKSFILYGGASTYMLDDMWEYVVP